MVVSNLPYVVWALFLLALTAFVVFGFVHCSFLIIGNRTLGEATKLSHSRFVVLSENAEPQPKASLKSIQPLFKLLSEPTLRTHSSELPPNLAPTTNSPEQLANPTSIPSILSPTPTIPSTPSSVSQHSYDVSYTSQTTFERTVYFRYLLHRWTGPLSIAVYLKPGEEKRYRQLLRSASFPSRLHVTPYFTNNTKIYPINYLRNLAIDNVPTSHFWLTDMDMWPSLGLREALMELPSDQLEREDLAVIVPAFELHTKNKNVQFKIVADYASRNLPRNKSELRHCMMITKCDTFRPSHRLHSYFFRQWYKDDYKPLLTPVKCFKGDKQEPYVMVKRSPNLPRFDERFINYGYNKVQWLEHLRWVGYDFQILTKGFAVDVPHAHSRHWATFVDQLFGKLEPGQSRVIPMLNLYEQFRRELRSNFTSKQVVKKCFVV